MILKPGIINRFLLLILITNCNLSFASKKDSLLNYFEDLKSRTMLVCLQTENPKIVEKYEKRGNSQELDLYRRAIKSTNENFIKSINFCWKLNPNIRVITIDSLEWFKENFPKKYGYITLANSLIHSSGAINVGYEKLESYANIGLHLFLCDRDKAIAFSSFPNDEIGQGEDKELKQNNVKYSEYFLSSPKFIYALYRISYFYTDLTQGIVPPLNSTNAINSGLIQGSKISESRSKTLVARLQDCEKGFDLEKAKKYYAAEIKIVSDEEFENYLFNKDQNTACFFVLLVSSSTMGNKNSSVTRFTYMQQVVNADDGSLANGFAGPSGLNYKVLEGFTSMLKILEKKKK